MISKSDWIAALRSGDYEQSVKGHFKEGDEHCAVGVYYDLVIKAGEGTWRQVVQEVYEPRMKSGFNFDHVLDTSSYRVMIDNDAKKLTFKEIADKAEAGAYG